MKSEAAARAEAPPFPGGGRTLTTPMRRSALSAFRFRPEIPPGGLRATMPPADAFVVLYQLTDHPAHDFRSGGKSVSVAALPASTLNVVDLSADPCAHFHAAVDTLMIHIPQMALDEIAEDATAARIGGLTATEGWETRDAVVDQLHPLILEGLSSPDPSDQLLRDHVLVGLGAHIACVFGGMRQGSARHRGGLTPGQEKRAKELLASDLAASLSLEEVARECGLSVGHFSRAFRSSVGTSPHAWLQDRRLDLARKLMLGSEANLAEIALHCGFADQSHLSRMFARATGTTPGAWRRNARS